MNLRCGKGCKVVFDKLDCGLDYQKEIVSNLLEFGNQYTVKYLHVSQSSSYVIFEEFPDNRFNTIFFSDTESSLIDSDDFNYYLSGYHEKDN